MSRANIKNNRSISSGTIEFLRSKRVRFWVSVIISLILYFSIIYSSQYIPLFVIGPNRIPLNIRVKLVDEKITVSQQMEEPISTSLSTRPISFQKFIDEILPSTEIPEPPHASSLQKEELAKQAVTELIDRPTETSTPDEVIQQIEERILMIEKESEKDTVDVARRILPPPEENIIKPDETPTFSLDNTVLSSQGTPISSSDIPRIIGTSPATEQTSSETTETNQAPVVLVPELEPIEPPIPIEQVLEQEIIEQPIMEETQKEKESRPYEFWDDLFELQLKTYYEQDKKQGFFQLVISPKKEAKITPLQKQVAFIIDSSASIGQRKLDQTIKGVREALQQLREEDLFNIILFRERASFFAEGYIKATSENKNSAQKFLQKIPSTGQTDVFNSVRQIIQIPTTPGLPNILWLYSDGKPTIGLRDTRAIIANLTLENQGKYEIFTTGGGNTIDRYLLELLAYLNRGFCVIRNNIDQLSTAIPQAFQKIQNPILIDVSMDFGAIPRDNIYPFIFPNFYQGVPVSIFGKFNPETQKNFVFRLQGNAAGKRKEIIFRADLSQSSSGDFDIAQKWAFHKAFYIIGRIVREGEKPELLQILNELKEKYNIKTTYTP